MPILRLRTSQLSEAERVDLEATLKDPSRFHSDGKEVGIACLVLPLLLIPLEVVLLNEVRGSYELYRDPEAPGVMYFLGLLHPHIRMFVNPEFLQLAGAVLLPIAIIAIAAYGLNTRGRHGHAITSFGVVRIRGTALRLLRYGDIAEMRTSERRWPRHNIITDQLDVVAKDGSSLTLYGFGLGRPRALIEAGRRQKTRDP